MVSLFSGNTAQEVEAQLAAAAVKGRVAVLGDVRLARRLGDAGRDILYIGPPARGLKRARGLVVVGSPGVLPLADGVLAALVASGVVELEMWEPFLAECCRVVEPGGMVVVVDRRAPAELARRTLCAGLTAIEQRSTGRTVITAGRWHPL